MRARVRVVNHGRRKTALSPEGAVDEHQSKTTKFLAGNQKNWSQISREAAQVSLLALSSWHTFISVSLRTRCIEQGQDPGKNLCPSTKPAWLIKVSGDKSS